MYAVHLQLRRTLTTPIGPHTANYCFAPRTTFVTEAHSSAKVNEGKENPAQSGIFRFKIKRKTRAFARVFLLMVGV